MLEEPEGGPVTSCNEGVSVTLYRGDESGGDAEVGGCEGSIKERAGREAGGGEVGWRL